MTMTTYGGSVSSTCRRREPLAAPVRVCTLGAVAASVALLRLGIAFVGPPVRNLRSYSSMELLARTRSEEISLYNAELAETSLDDAVIDMDELMQEDEDDDDDAYTDAQEKAFDLRRPRTSIRNLRQIDLNPKFRREGYFDRADLPRLDPTDFDRSGVLQTLSVEELERRTQFRWGLDSKYINRQKRKRQGVPETAQAEAAHPKADYNPYLSRPLRAAKRKPRVRVDTLTEPSTDATATSTASTAPLPVARSVNRTSNRRPKSHGLTDKAPKSYATQKPLRSELLAAQHEGLLSSWLWCHAPPPPCPCCEVPKERSLDSDRTPAGDGLHAQDRDIEH